MLHPLLSRPPSRVRTLLIVLVAPLALLGVTFCSYLLLIPLGAAVIWWPTGPSRWFALLATLAAYGIFAHRGVQNARVAWRNTGSVAIDHIMFALGCIIWSIAAVLFAVYA